MQIHSGPSIFQHAGQFPGAEAVGIPLSNEALRFYKSGPPFLHNYFPFWMAALIGKLIVLIPILAVLYPIMKSLPRLYDWTDRRRASARLTWKNASRHELSGLVTSFTIASSTALAIASYVGLARMPFQSGGIDRDP